MDSLQEVGGRLLVPGVPDKVFLSIKRDLEFWWRCWCCLWSALGRDERKKAKLDASFFIFNLIFIVFFFVFRHRSISFLSFLLAVWIVSQFLLSHPDGYVRCDCVRRKASLRRKQKTNFHSILSCSLGSVKFSTLQRELRDKSRGRWSTKDASGKKATKTREKTL